MKDILQNVKRWGIADANNNNNKQTTAAELKFISSKNMLAFHSRKNKLIRIHIVNKLFLSSKLHKNSLPNNALNVIV